MSYPLTWKPLSEDWERERERLFESGSSQLNNVLCEQTGVIGPQDMIEVATRVYQFKVRPDDIWVLTFPKCGTTWTQELVWQIVNNVDIEAARKLKLYERTTFIECEGLEKDYKSLDIIEGMPSPRVIKTHLPLEMLPPNLLDTCKVVFVCRNPKDTCVSFFNHFQTIPGYEVKESTTFADFAQLWMDGNMEFGNYWFMLKSAWRFKDHPNMKIMWYEDMKRQLIPVIKDVAKFLGYHLTELKVLELDDHLFIDNFKKFYSGDDTANMKIRKGQVGDWKNYFTGEDSKLWDEWIEENLKGTSIKLPEHIAGKHILKKIYPL